MKVLRNRVLPLILVLLSLLGGMRDAAGYQNPIRGMDYIADPGVLHHNGVYYLYATTSVDTVGNNIGIGCWSSPDLVHWRPEGWAFLVTSSTWAQRDLAAPEAQFKDGKFLLFFNAKPGPDRHERICLAESDSPTGPFRETKAPLFEDTTPVYDPYVYTDDDGRTYLYYATIRLNLSYLSINVREMTPDLRGFRGKPVQDLLARPYSDWEINPRGVPIVEGTNILKHKGLYYLIYSGNAYDAPGYAVGYATGPTPRGPFTRYAGNPILKSDLNTSRPVSGPGTGHVVPSPDGTELFYVYNAHTDPNEPDWIRSLYIDRMSFRPDGVLQIHGPTTDCQPDPSTGGPGSAPKISCPEPFTGIPTSPVEGTTGWLPLHSQVEGFAWTGRDPERGHIVAHVTQDPHLNRRTGVFSAPESWLPYSEIGPDNYVRAKFAIYRANQKDPDDPRQIPNIRLRAAVRFAYGNILEVYHHLTADPGSEPVLHEMAPSADPERPSVYTVDFDPIDVPALADTPGEGVMRAFEAYALEPQENGDLVLAESSIGVYPRSLLPDSNDPEILKKVYQPGAAVNDAGNLRSVIPADTQRHVQVIPIFEGFRQMPDNSGVALPVYREAGLASTDPPPGVTLDTTTVPSNRLGIVVRDFFPGADRTAADYVRIEPGRQYKIRWHLTSTGPANRNANIRLRTRTLKWGWNFKTELGGAFAAGLTNNTIAQETLPGVGTRNPDRIGNENGGWYTQLVHVPLDPAIRPEFPEGTPLAQRMPLMSAQPGPGVDAPSLLDLKFGIDLLDTLDVAAGYEQEKGNVTLDRIEVRSYPRVMD